MTTKFRDFKFNYFTVSAAQIAQNYTNFLYSMCQDLEKIILYLHNVKTKKYLNNQKEYIFLNTQYFKGALLFFEA